MRWPPFFLPKRSVIIWHGGYLAHNGKNHRLAAIHQQLNLPKPLPKISLPFSLQMLHGTGENYSQCSKCKEGKMERVASYLQHNGTLVNVNDLNRQRTKNKASPPKINTGSSNRLMVKKHLLKTKTKPLKIMGRGNYAQEPVRKGTKQNWPLQNPSQSTTQATYESYKTP